MKSITVLIPTYNEEKNIIMAYERVKRVFLDFLSGYNCNILFVDNCSTDETQSLIRSLCSTDKNVKAIFNVKNFGLSRSQFNGLRQSFGDAVVLMNSDMQDPPEVIPRFVDEWKKGAKVVCGIKTKSQENPFMYFIRKLFYKLIGRLAEIEHIDQFDCFGLYDKSFIDILKKMDDNLPYLRGIVSEYGADISRVVYTQDKRKFGKSHFHFMSLYDVAMLGVTSYSKVIMHLCTLFGAVLSVASVIVALITCVRKILNWDSFQIGMAAMEVGVFFIGAVQILFIGLVGEYIVNINIRTMRHPIVIEKERINF